MDQTTPATPSRKSVQQESTVNSAPNSKGITAGSGSVNDLRRDNIARWLLDDVKKTLTAPIEAMLHTFTRRICKEPQMAEPKEMFQKILAIANEMVNEFSTAKGSTGEGGQTASTTIEETTKAEQRKQRIKEMESSHHAFVTAKTETDSYPPWVNMTNIALSLLRDEVMDGVRDWDKEIKLILQHNDPKALRSNHNFQESKRKPDCIFMTTSTACALHGVPPKAEWTDAEWTDFAKKWATRKPSTENDLNWGDALSTIECKRHKPRIVDLKEDAVLEEKSFEAVLKSDHIRDVRKRKRGSDGDGMDNGSVSKSQKKKNIGSPHTSSPLTGPSHSEQKATSSAHLSQLRALPFTDWTTSVSIQSVEYALQRLCCSFDMTHTFNLILIDTTLYISWYDHEGIITTHGFDIAKNLNYYLALLFILQRFGRSDWGRCANSNFDTTPHSDQAVSSLFHEVKVKEKTFLVDLTEQGLVHKSWALGGRSSCLRLCQMKEGEGWSEKRYVIKFSWKEKTRKSEGDILRTIHRKASSDAKIINSLPELITDDIYPDISTKDIRMSVGLESHPRELVVSVLTKLDGTIKGLTGDDLWNVFWDCFRCHYLLWKLGVEHRDISTGNLMYWRDNDGHAHGVLADFDLSSLSGEPSNNKQRTGTLPYMAIELLYANKPIVHRYDHDVESFYWVLLYAILCGGDGNPECPMAGWGNFGMAELVEKKSTYLEVYQHADLFQPTLEHRKIDFARFAGIRVIVPGHRHQVNMKNIALEQDDDSDPEFVIPPLDMDGLYDKIEAKRTKHLKKYPLEKARPDPGAILARP